LLIGDCGLRIADEQADAFFNPQSEIRIPQSHHLPVTTGGTDNLPKLNMNFSLRAFRDILTGPY
jgi:hypothetical protein